MADLDRDHIARLIGNHQRRSPGRCECNWRGSPGELWILHVADLLLPLIAEARREGAAEALEKVAQLIFDDGDARALGTASVLRSFAASYRTAAVGESRG